MKLNLKDLALDKKAKEEFLEKVEQFTDVFSLRDEIGTCPFIEVHLKLKDEILKHLGIIRKGLTG